MHCRVALQDVNAYETTTTMLVKDRDCVRMFGNPAAGGKITPSKIFKDWKEISSKFQTYPHLCDCAHRLSGLVADI